MKNKIGTLIRSYILKRNFNKMVSQNLENQKSSLVKKFSKSGFLPSKIRDYNLPTNGVEDYVTDWYRLNIASKINGEYGVMLTDKLVFHKFFKHDNKVVQPFGYIYEQKIYEFESNIELSFQSFADKLYKEGNPFIAKALKGGGGNNIFVFTPQECSYSDFLKTLKNLADSRRNFVFQHILKQTGFASTLNPDSVNTIRVLTMQNPANGKPFIAKMIQRVGIKKSKFLDNFESGGISIDINLDTGIYGLGALRGESGTIEFIKQHPDTNVTFFGQKVENFEVIKSIIIEKATQMDFLKYIGWDIIPMDNNPLILEANNNSGLTVFQIHKPLLTDAKVKDFYDFYNNSVFQKFFR